MGGDDIPRNDTDARVTPRCRTLRSYVNRLSRRPSESALIYADALPVSSLFLLLLQSANTSPQVAKCLEKVRALILGLIVTPKSVMQLNRIKEKFVRAEMKLVRTVKLRRNWRASSFDELEKASTHKSAKTHAGNGFFVTRDLDLIWPLDPKIIEFPVLFVEHFHIKFGNPSCIRF